MDWKANYTRWKHAPELVGTLKEELQAIEADEQLLEDCFYKSLEFGTGGMRGIIGPGTNRINVYTIRKASQGLANFILEQGPEAQKRGVVIAYDSRHYSYEFAREAALTLGKNGIQTYLFDRMRPTPMLSFAVRHLHAFAGIVITASHNPPAYNGYKVYGEDGGQLTSEPADRLVAHVGNVENELQIDIADERELRESGLLQTIGSEIDLAYTEQLRSIVINDSVIRDMQSDLQIVYTPLHGTGHIPIREGLRALGFRNVTVVQEQAVPDPNFSTVTSPNPEEEAAFHVAMQYGERMNADVLMATDPDADRMGVAVKNIDGDYVVLTGNETGALMLHYLLSERQKQGTLPHNAVMLKTIVTSELGRTIANAYDVKTIDTLTGFKYISEQIEQFTKDETATFMFGYEESYGYLVRDFVRDKDAIQAALFAAEMAAFYKANGQTLYEALLALYAEYGYYRESLASLTLEGKQGLTQMDALLTTYRNHPPVEIAGQKVTVIEDYRTSMRTYVDQEVEETIALPVANVLKYKLADESWICMRPSGTEPKIKFYFGVKGSSLADSKQRLTHLEETWLAEINQFMAETDHA